MFHEKCRQCCVAETDRSVGVREGTLLPESSSPRCAAFALDGTDHRSHKEQGSMIRRYIIWRNRHADDTRLRQVVARANVP
ncbi:hypothetical protein [Streptomyces sp. NPDC048496]|uniref:hypothetical protein n=1 Tax=Streptomyces sp. NPDC048496 TaxID=3365558 RepID=UPI00371DBB09